MLRNSGTSPETYRSKVATGIPGLIFAYLAIVWPLIAWTHPATIDLVTGLVAQQTVDYPTNKVFYPLVFALTLVLYFLEWPKWDRVEGISLFVLVGVLVYFAMTSIWALVPDHSIKQSLMLVLSLFSVMLASKLSQRADRVLLVLFWICCLAAFLNFLAVLLTDPTPIGHRGIYPAQEQSGVFCIFVSVFRIVWDLEQTHAAGRVALDDCGCLSDLSKSVKNISCVGFGYPLHRVLFIHDDQKVPYFDDGQWHFASAAACRCLDVACCDGREVVRYFHDGRWRAHLYRTY